ncbi:MAG: NAD(P)H-hydrate epimerase, partial [Dehalococcoidia bacterium]
MAIPSVETEVPFLTTDQMREVDRAMVEEFGILLFQMMEHAGRGLAMVARRRFFDGDPRGRRVLALAGAGGNGGGGLVAARWLHNWGADVQVRLAAPAERLGEVPRHQLAVLRRLDVVITEGAGPLALPSADLVLDAIIGYSLRGSPSGLAAEAIRAANDHAAPVLALDLPSGVDATSGTVHQPAIRAAATLTLALPKVGLRTEAARRCVGELYLADIGVPPELYARP